MIIGIPSEIKNNENRVGMTPAGVSELVKRGHTVYLQKGAGVNSGFPDEEYISVGAKYCRQSKMFTTFGNDS
jgi:alanine dehydrogenase